ncbi:MAG: hypothetical protein ABIA59_07715 [Candidatus Latescibacterota bacterium]
MLRSKRFATLLVLICAAVTAFGCGSSSTSPEEVSEAPLLPPTHVVARQDGSGNILVAWQQTNQANVVGFNVYRAVSGSGNFTLLNPAPVTGTTYLDNAVQYGVGYVYRVRSVNSGDQESVYRSVNIFNILPKNPGAYPPPDGKDVDPHF